MPEQLGSEALGGWSLASNFCKETGCGNVGWDGVVSVNSRRNLQLLEQRIQKMKELTVWLR